jgi:hypothetical protein
VAAEDVMRKGTLLVILWLAIGAAASGQRGYFNTSNFAQLHRREPQDLLQAADPDRLTPSD